ncbi:TetR/AcrR family transcriptional regulator [Arenimonas terrae]|uniref:TetR/AcrR family transcriptional regulator n=1 Tax=Arenimonas terrae TaxID=2546226 RepID=A0A5C4RQC7_9GAMM|nr:TetR/AcrR family transcriptional regulator [Arenimonas terrae]TNJ33268.1 TetR/AcrR family transcriptional regulator [Arenimonas terrae]
MTIQATPRGQSRQRQRENTRRQLLEAGLRMVAVHGFAGTTTAAIAKETGKAHGTVFVHFQTRDALVTELVEEVGREMSRRLAEMPSDTPTLSEVLDAHLLALAEHEVLYACLLREASTLPLAARARVFALQAGVAWRLREAHERDLATGTVRAGSSAALSNLWIAWTNHFLMNRDLLAPDASVIRARGAELKAQFLDFVRP